MIESINVIGARGRVGKAVSARLAERGVRLAPAAVADGVLLCVPDRAIAEVAATVPAGPWLGHVSGATPLAALAPHTRRFGLHPLQTFTHERGPEQLDGAFAAVTGETTEAVAFATSLAGTLGLRPFPLAEDARALYHCGAAIASNYLVTLYRAAARLFAVAGAPSEGLVPLMRRTIENDFALTGPIDRGDWSTVERHLEVLVGAAPELLPLYETLARATAGQAGVGLPDRLGVPA